MPIKYLLIWNKKMSSDDQLWSGATCRAESVPLILHRSIIISFYVTAITEGIRVYITNATNAYKMTKAKAHMYRCGSEQSLQAVQPLEKKHDSLGC